MQQTKQQQIREQQRKLPHVRDIAARTSRTSRREACVAAPQVAVTVRVRALGSADVAHDLAAKPEAHSQPKENSSAARLLLHLQWWRRNDSRHTTAAHRARYLDVGCRGGAVQEGGRWHEMRR